LRSTRRRRSALAPILVEQTRRGAGRDEPGEAPVASATFGGCGPQQTSPLERGKPRGWIRALGRRRGYQLGDDVSPVGDLHVLAGTHQAHVLAEPILQLSKADLLHGPNVASWGLIVNARHPVIRTHPVSGRKALFVNSGFTTRIVQLKRPESDAILQFLFRHIETPEFQCRFRWQERSVAFWDNRCVQHHAMWDYFPQRRHGHRVTIRGDKPFYRP
jgi:Taurine catabolism dioxygenase TauD, TfdA family